MTRYAVRASSVADFFDCPERWAARNLDGKRSPSSAPAAIGTAVHASTAVFDEQRLLGSPISADDAAEVVEKQIRYPDEEVDWGGMPLKQALIAGLGAHNQYCIEIAPKIEFEAVEVTLPALDIDIPIDGVIVTLALTGTLDRIRRVDTEIGPTYGISDLKTGARACSQSSGKHKAQIGVYELLAQHGMDYNIELPGQIIQLQTSTNYQAGLAEVQDARLALLGTPYRQGLLTHMARMLLSGDFYGNPGSMLCSGKFCPRWEDCLWR